MRLLPSLATTVLLSTSLLAQSNPLVIAHRGASGYLPEHTLAAATLAYQQGADYLEQDLVLSKDGVPVVLHDIHLDTVTNVEQVFPGRHRADGRYYVIDFTLAELKQLHVHERQSVDGQQVFPDRWQGVSPFTIATFEEHLALRDQLQRQLGRTVGIYPEIKSPAWHREQGQDISSIVLSILRKHGLDNASAPVFIQCFDFAETQRLRRDLGVKAKLVQLLGENDWQESATDYDRLKTTEGLKRIAEVADGIGPWLPQIVDVNTLAPTGLVKAAHQQGLVVHPYTFRLEQLPQGLDAAQTLHLLFSSLQVDGVFSDFPDVAVAHRDTLSDD
ncbi:glycerophosphodiester phosphodiesterase [Aestuariibacter halophilus]|uniref:glycerophosphodiester phosphodiesterase n=1 Tax=Fluctibacter halophilus TaxID=226011 RepID=A0ABS8G8A7_9ALTE|nr:glycerophosphodiester phosphodiesterase [Aestuariibacter halophilus]MCC2616780.1 glycerophosphodiester phosphodiesterase [Aestuariibacter halophilus]